VKSKKYKVKNLSSGEEKELGLTEIAKYISS